MTSSEKPYAEVIGDPIAHSKSPLIHQFWLNKLGIEADYRTQAIAPEELAGYFETRRADPAWRGCNLTMPHKVAALEHVEDRGSVRDGIGAINTVFRDGDALIGTNTDAAGFAAPVLEVDLDGSHAIVIGSGGAARAVLFALGKLGVGQVTMLSRNPLKAAALLARFGIKGLALPLDTRLPGAALLVNASPLGMAGQPDLAIDLSPLSDDAIVYDLVYAPLVTPLLAAAEARGLEAIDGLEMLVGQAALSFALFFGFEPPREHDAALRGLVVA